MTHADRIRQGVLLVAALLATGVATGCAVGFPGRATHVSDRGATLNGVVFSNLEGDTAYWYRYGTSAGYGSETPHRTVSIHEGAPQSVSAPIAGLTPGTSYHHQLCVKDAQESPDRICSKDQTVTTRPPGGASGIAFISSRGGSGEEVYRMNADGSGVVRVTDNYGFTKHPSWSPDGSQIAFLSGLYNDPPWQAIYLVNADGSGSTAIGSFYSSDDEPAWSPDGARIAFRSYPSGYSEIWTMNPDGSDPVRLSAGQGYRYDGGPSWSPDGAKIAFATARDGNSEIYVMSAGGSNPTRLTNNPASDLEPAWSPDGAKIAFTSDRDGNSEIYVIGAGGSNPTRLTNNAAIDQTPAWSPDGAKIAFATFRDGNYEVYVMNADGSSPTRLTNDPGFDWMPAWSPRQ
jgi:Tol biopolymer transport system component